jgi:hypothetical protein
MQPDIHPARIMEIGTGFMPARVLLTAIELDLFTLLAGQGATATRIAAELGLASHVTDFLDTLVALELLARDGDGPDSVYRNTPETGAFLDQRSPTYLGGLLDMMARRLYRVWAGFTDSLRTGQAKSELAQGGDDVFQALYADAGAMEKFLAAMEAAQIQSFVALAEKFDFAGRQHLCDVGGGNGALSIAVARRHPGLRCTSFDLPAVVPVTRRRVESAGLTGRIEIAGGNFFTDPLPGADVITMGNILHDWGLDKKRALIARVHAALPAGGVFIAIENVIDDARRTNVRGLLMSLNMLLETGEGFDYTGAQFDTWCREAGFRRTEIVPLAGTTSAAIAYK